MQRILFTILIAWISLIPSCRDWEEHYHEALKNLPDYNLFEYIETSSNLGIFSEMLKATGYDTIISASQTYTVWAPDNQALEGIDRNDTELITEIIKNHIARGNFSTSGILSKPVKMLNGKNVNFERETSGFTFGNVTIVEPNIPASNGQIHLMNGYVPYRNNILEFINRTESLDSLAKYLNSQNEWIFDPVNSIEIGFDPEGQVIYDSVFIFSNFVLNQLGSLGSEDSIYTAILPDNSAWIEAYERALSYFNIPEVYGGAVRMHMATRWAIVKDMVFRELVYDPGTFQYLVSTSQNVFYSPLDLFADAQQYEMSNGIGYVTNQMPFADTASWFKTIVVEAESDFDRENTNSNIYVRTGLGTGLDISGDNYIVVDPTGISNIAQPSVRFSIPNTLSSVYDMYCVFVPASIVDPANTRPNRATFQLTYVTTTLGRTRRVTLTPENNVTNPAGLTIMHLGQIDFEFANVIDRDYDEIAVKLQVTNDVKIEEENAGDFSRTMRIDCIIFKPVSE